MYIKNAINFMLNRMVVLPISENGKIAPQFDSSYNDVVAVGKCTVHTRRCTVEVAYRSHQKYGAAKKNDNSLTDHKRERARKSRNTDKNHGRPTEDLRQPRRDPVQNLVAAMQVLLSRHREAYRNISKNRRGVDSIGCFLEICC